MDKLGWHPFACPKQPSTERRVMTSEARIYKIKISGNETAPSWAIMLAIPAILIGIGVFMSSDVYGCLVLLGVVAFFVYRFQTVVAEVDIATRRLLIVRDFLGWWKRFLVDCSFDECKAVGVAMHSEGRDQLYIEFIKDRPTRYFTVRADELPAEVAASLAKLLDVPQRDMKC